MINEEYELLVYDIVYETLLEVYQSYEEVEPISEEYLLERKSDFEKIASKYISSKLKEAQAVANDILETDQMLLKEENQKIKQKIDKLFDTQIQL